MIDKPSGLTSHKVVSILRRLISQQSIGHTGTLDPMATGIMIMCLGSATALSRFFTTLPKEYLGEMVLGRTSTTYDTDGKVEIQDESPDIKNELIERVIQSFTGEQYQIPPRYSAVRVGGKRLYEYARRGQDVIINPRRIVVYSIEILEFINPIVRFKTMVSSGTYIRTLVHDIGAALGCGALLCELRRTRVGTFRVEDSIDFSCLTSPSFLLDNAIIPVYDAVDFIPRCIIHDTSITRVRSGQAITGSDIIDGDVELADKQEVLLFDSNMLFVAIARVSRSDKGGFLLSPKRVFHD